MVPIPDTKVKNTDDAVNIKTKSPRSAISVPKNSSMDLNLSVLIV